MGKPQPWWRCSGCKGVYKVNLPGMEDIPRPPEDEIPEVGICVTCYIQSQDKRQKGEGTMGPLKVSKDVGLQVGDPEYWDLLEGSLLKAKMLLWKRLQHGAYADDEEAKATMDAYWALRKVVALLEKNIRQVPMPETPLDTLKRANREREPQEVANDPES